VSDGASIYDATIVLTTFNHSTAAGETAISVKVLQTLDNQPTTVIQLLVNYTKYDI
jgi:hypothetical protein